MKMINTFDKYKTIQLENEFVPHLRRSTNANKNINIDVKYSNYL